MPISEQGMIEDGAILQYSWALKELRVVWEGNALIRMT